MMRPLLLTLGDYRNLKLSGAMRLSYLVQLFPDSFKETLCDQLLQFLRDLLDILLQAQKGTSSVQFYYEKDWFSVDCEELTEFFPALKDRTFFN